jgi:hypothetical protein
MIEPTLVQPFTCPHCGLEMSAGYAPYVKETFTYQPNAVILCIQCLQWMRLDADLRAVALTEADEARLSLSDRLDMARMRATIEGVKAEHDRKTILLHNPPLTLRIHSLWAYVATDKEGNEGVTAAQIGNVMMPLFAADEARLANMKPIARAVCNATGMTLHLVKFTSRVELNTMAPDQKGDDNAATG